MLSNLLVVLGICFFFGGINWIKQHFNITVADTTASLLALYVSSLIIPTAFHSMLSGKFNDGFRPIIDMSIGKSRSEKKNSCN